MLVHLLYDIGIGRCLFGQYNHVGIGGELGNNVHGDTYHTEIVLQELLAGRLVGLVTLYSYGITKQADGTVHLLHGIAGCPCHGGGGYLLSVDIYRFHHIIVVETGAAGILPGTAV